MKKIYILPNLVTTANFLCGIVALMSVYNGKVKQAAVLILFAMIFDFFDGSLARLQKATSEFGMEYDSLADLVSFGIAPVFIVYSTVLSKLGRLGIGVVFLYCTCAALRLARFNVQMSVSSTEGKTFRGFPTPAAAGIIASWYLLMEKYGMTADLPYIFYALPPLLIILSYLMVSNIRYPTLYEFNILRQKHFLYLVFLVIIIGVMLLNIEVSLVVLFFVYMLIGPLRSTRIFSRLLTAEKKSGQNRIAKVTANRKRNIV